MYRAERKYRGRVEILRDFLGAIRTTGTKTRIIGLANLNPNSFERYLDFCLSLDLVQELAGEYRLTARADTVLDAIERLLLKSDEVDSSLSDFHRAFNRSRATALSPRTTLRYVSRIAWEEVLRATQDAVPPTRGRLVPSDSPELDSNVGTIRFDPLDSPRSEPLRGSIPSLGEPNLVAPSRRRPGSRARE